MSALAGCCRCHCHPCRRPARFQFYGVFVCFSLASCRGARDFPEGCWGAGGLGTSGLCRGFWLRRRSRCCLCGKRSGVLPGGEPASRGCRERGNGGGPAAAQPPPQGGERAAQPGDVAGARRAKRGSAACCLSGTVQVP